MASGVKVVDVCGDRFQGLKSRKYKYVTFKVSDDLTEIVPDEDMCKAKSGYDEILETLAPLDQPRYVFYDYNFDTADGHREEIIMISWCPDHTKIKKKMLHASSKDALAKKLQFGGKTFQATETSDITEECILQTLMKGK